MQPVHCGRGAWYTYTGYPVRRSSAPLAVHATTSILHDSTRYRSMMTERCRQVPAASPVLQSRVLPTLHTYDDRLCRMCMPRLSHIRTSPLAHCSVSFTDDVSGHWQDQKRDRCYASTSSQRIISAHTSALATPSLGFVHCVFAARCQCQPWCQPRVDLVHASISCTPRSRARLDLVHASRLDLVHAQLPQGRMREACYASPPKLTCCPFQLAAFRRGF